jgi:hypothetical protein
MKDGDGNPAFSRSSLNKERIKSKKCGASIVISGVFRTNIPAELVPGSPLLILKTGFADREMQGEVGLPANWAENLDELESKMLT